MSGASGRIAWEYGLDYGRGPRQSDGDAGEWKGLVITSSRIGAWRVGGREVEWFDEWLRPLTRQSMPGLLQDAWAIGASRWAAIIAGRVVLYDEHHRIERSIEPHAPGAWRLGCAVDESTLCLAGDDGLAMLNLTDGSVHVEAVGLRGVAGLASDARGQRLAMTHAGDNVAWLASRRSPRRLERLAMGLEPDNYRLRLHAPRGCSFDGDALWVADSNNNRVVCLALPDGSQLRSIDHVNDGQSVSPLWRPVAVHALGHGQLVVLDSKNRRIVRMDGDGRQLAATGPAVITRRHFHLPRSVTPTANAGLLVCDSHQNRLVMLQSSGHGVTSSVRHAGIAWPRHAVESDGDLLVIGGHATELLRIRPSGRVEPWRHAGWALPPLRDPHQCVRDEFGVLVVNSGAGEIIARRGDRTIVIGEVLGRALSDPHAADFTNDGGLVIADTGNDRLVFSDPSWQQWRELREIALPTGSLALHQPRFVSRERGRHYLIIDTGSRLIVRMDLTGQGSWAFGTANQVIPERADACGIFTWEQKLFHDPRWVVSPAPGQLVVSDTGNCRVVSVQLHGEIH